MRKISLYVLATFLVLIGVGGWIASTTQARVEAITQIETIDPSRITMSTRALPTEQFTDYTFVFNWSRFPWLHGQFDPLQNRADTTRQPPLFLRGLIVGPLSYSTRDGAPTMHAFFDNVVSQQGLATPSIATYLASEMVFSAASTTGRLLANRSPVELKRQVKHGQLSSIGHKTIYNIDESLGASGNLVYGGYPYDPFVEPVNH
jgi:hypothetical protein